MAENLGSIRAEILLEIDSVQRGATQAGQAVNDMVDEIGESMRDFRNDIEESFGSMEDLAQDAGVAMLGAGTVMAGALIAMAANASQTEKTMRKFEAQTGLAGDELINFQDSIDESFLKGYGDSIEDIADAYQQFQRSLDLTSEQTKELVEGSYILTDLYDYDMATAVNANTALMKNFGLTGKKSLDIITESVRLSGDRSEDLLDTFSEYSQQFSKLGFSAEQFAGILVKGLENGQFNTDQLADSTKEFGVNLLELADSGDDALKDIIQNETVYKSVVDGLKDGTTTTANAMSVVNALLGANENELERNRLGVALYGSLWEEVGGDVVLSLTGANVALEDFDGANKKAGDTMKGNNVTMEQVTRQFETLSNEIGKELAPYLSKAINLVSKLLSKILGFIEANPVITKVIAIVGVLASAFLSVVGAVILLYPYIQTAITVFGAIGSTIGTVVAAIGTFIGAIGALPIIIGAAIIALVVLIILNWEKVKSTTILIWNAIVEFFKTLPETLQTLWTTILTWIVTAFETFNKKAQEIWTGIVEFIKTIPSILYNFFTTTLPEFIGFVLGSFVRLHIKLTVAIINFFIVKLPQLVSAGLTAVKNFFTKTLPKIVVYVGLMVIRLLVKFNQMKAKMWYYAGVAVAKVIAFFKSLPSKIYQYASSMYYKAKALAYKGVNGAKAGIKSLPSVIYNAVLDAIKGVGSLGSKAWSALKNIGSSMWSGFKKGLGISSPSYIEEAIFDINRASSDMTSVLRNDFRRLARMPQITSMSNLADKQSSNLTNVRNIQTFNAPLFTIGNANDLQAGQQINNELYNQVLLKLRQGGEY